MEIKMENKQLQITFTDSPQEEVARIQKEFSLSDAAQELERAILSGEQMSEEAHIKLAEVLSAFKEMFSINLPELGETPEETLRTSSRDINLSRLLRERGLVRLYRLLREKTEDGIPLYMLYINPYTDSPFQKKEDFVGWIAKDAHIPRSTLFMRFSTYDKMLGLGFDLEDAFNTIITKPYAMRQVLNMIAEWNRKGQITKINPETAKQIANQVYSDEEREVVASFADAYKENPTPVALKSLVQRVTPAVKSFIKELAETPNTKDMMEHVQHDVLKKPEIQYTWVDDSLVVTIIRKEIAEDGTEVISNIEDIPFIPDYPTELDEFIVDDIITRLPVKNRRQVFAERERRKAQKDMKDELPF